MRTICLVASLALALGLVAGCGGGGSSGGPSPSEGTPFVADLSQHHVVVRYDIDGDGIPDVLTLDPAADPYVVVEALAGTADGGTVDATDRLGGRTIDPAISDAISDFLGQAIGVDRETDLQVVVGSDTVDVTVMG